MNGFWDHLTVWLGNRVLWCGSGVKAMLQCSSNFFITVLSQYAVFQGCSGLCYEQQYVFCWHGFVFFFGSFCNRAATVFAV